MAFAANAPALIQLSRLLSPVDGFRIAVNVAVALMLGVLYIGSGNEGSRVLANYNLLFAILLHCSMATMMLTVLTCMLHHNFLIISLIRTETV